MLRLIDHTYTLPFSDTLTAFPTILDEKMGANENAKIGEQAKQSSHHSLFNTQLLPVLTVTSVEIPEGEYLPENIPLVEITMDDVSRGQEMHKRNEAAFAASGHSDHFYQLPATATFVHSESSDDETLPEDSILDFPVFPDVPHADFSHRDLNSLPAADLHRSQGHFHHPKNLKTGFHTLEKLEEIDYENEISHRYPQPAGGQTEVDYDEDDLGFSGPEFRPTMRKVIMSHEDLISTLRSMIHKEEDEVDQMERAYLDSILNLNAEDDAEGDSRLR